MYKKIVSFIICLTVIVSFVSFRTMHVTQDPWRAPAWADTLRNPYPVRWGAKVAPQALLSEGEKMYNLYCASCHGINGSGEGAPGMTFEVKPANFHSKGVASQKDGALFWKLSEGRGAMPGFKSLLSSDKRWQIISYIRQLGNADLGNPVNVLPKSLPVKGFSINRTFPSKYFPLPSKVLNVYSSEKQRFMVDTVVSGLILPWSIVFLPDGSVLIAERSGRLRQVKNGKMQENPIGGNVPKELRDIKLHPQFAKNSLVYITYYIDPVKPLGGYTALMQAKLVGDKLIDEKILYKGGPFNQSAFFYGSRIEFDKSGFLFMTAGIAGPRTNAQDLSTVAGKTLRFNDDGSIPKDNPFVNKAGALPEIFSYGHRMHQGLALNPKTGKLFSTEFGELGGDELNIIKPGANYGWPEVSYSLEYSGAVLAKDSLRAGIEAPVHHWTFAPSDLDFVSGERYPGWDTNVFIGGLLKRSLLRAELKDDKFVHDEILLQNIGRIRDVKFGPDKFLYIMTEDTGLIVRLVPVVKNN
ncbi:PQQ-dependent sugar dehydrogenase [Daejeonella sp.]|uniref:PQQ-dependent sugar dehydrogenase n=1 Tax=Daejeonella sp. TaxID=2805397 RepID=UPI0030C3DF99